MTSDLKNKLEKASAIASLPRVQRWLKYPRRHAIGLFQRYFLNRLFGNVAKLGCVHFSGDKIHVPLPAGLDIYLTGIKTHDSEIRLSRYIIANPSKTALDCGAHIGFYSILLSYCFDTVDAFEPSPEIGDLLIQNTAAIENIKVVQAALSNKVETMPFYTYPIKYSEYNTGEKNALESDLKSKVKIVSVPYTTLDSYCQKHELAPSLLKIDVEGGELKLLQGAKHIIKQHQPTIVIEIRKDKFDTLYQPVVELFQSMSYSAFRIKPDGELVRLENIKEWICNLNDDSDNLVFKATQNIPITS